MQFFFRLGLLLSVHVFASVGVGADMIRTVAVTGQSVPGVAGDARFLDFGEPLLNASGQIAFTSIYGGDRIGGDGIWAGEPGSLAVVMRSGEQAIGLADGTLYSSFNIHANGRVAFASNGQVAFIAGLTGNGVEGSNGWGVWTGAIGASRLVLRGGSHAPGTPTGVTFSNIEELTVNSAGQTAFRALVTGSGVTSSNREGLWSEGSGSLTLVARLGDQAPGLPSGVHYAGSISDPTINSSGHVAFDTWLDGGHPDFNNIESIWSDRTGSPALIVRDGDPVPDMPGNATFRWVGWDAPAVLNAQGGTAFSAAITGDGVSNTNDSGIWSERNGTLSQVVRRGAHAPGASSGVIMDELLEPVTDSAGNVTFFARLKGAGVNNSNNQGIWSDSSGALKLIAREGDQAPGLPSGVVFNSFETFPMINEAGQSAFGATVRGGQSFYGIWAEDRNRQLKLVIREGGMLEVAAGDYRTVESLAYDLRNNGDAYAFNVLGQIAFRAAFTDGSYGIFISELAAAPEPSSLVIFSPIAATLLVRRGRKSS